MKRLKYRESRDTVCIDSDTARAMTRLITEFPEEIPDFREGVIPELGTGKGTYSNACLEQGLDVYAIDIRSVREIPGFKGNQKRFLQAEARHLPFKTESFNLVIENLFFDDVVGLQGLGFSLDAFVREIHRVLKSPGFLFTSNRESSVLKSRLFSEEKTYGAYRTVYRKL